MQTRGYVPGKVFWAALTARLTRDYDDGAKGQRYVEIGDHVQKRFRFTYLYPALQEGNAFRTHYPWEEDFDYLFLNSYASTALNYTRQSAEDAMLHETEYIAPYTRDGQPVYLTGQLFVNTELSPPLDHWKDALDRLQFGAERGYGWGRLQLVSCNKGEPVQDAPRAQMHNNRITAHLIAENITGVTGPIEPLIGWERNNDEERKSNWKLSKQAIICYAPGTRVPKESSFNIGSNGVWEMNANRQ